MLTFFDSLLPTLTMSLTLNFSDLELKAILRRYRQLPGIESVRMDIDLFNGKQYTDDDNDKTSLIQGIMPRKKNIQEWFKISNGDTSLLSRNTDNTQITIQGLDGTSMYDRPYYQHELSDEKCISSN